MPMVFGRGIFCNRDGWVWAWQPSSSRSLGGLSFPGTEADLQQVLKHLESQGTGAGAATRARHSGRGRRASRRGGRARAAKEGFIEEILYEKMLGARTKLERGLPFVALAAG